MNDFEKVFEDLDVQIAGMDGALESVTGQSSAESDAVTQLLQQMQGDQALAANQNMVAPQVGKIEDKNEVQEEVKNDEMDDMERRMAALRM